MSRNFELLQRIGREQAIYTTATAPEGEPETFAEQPAVFAGPPATALAMSGGELEEFTKLVQRLFIMPGNEAPRSVVFTATDRGNGCSWVCAHAAEVLASQVSGSVCLVDANLRRPGLHSQFSVENHYGLSDALMKPDPVRTFARNLGRPNLWMVSCGSGSEDAQNLLTSDRMRLRMSELRAEFDYVLLDAAALSDANDAVLLGCGADGVVLVLKANTSRRESARKAMHDIQAAKARVLGAVLNHRTFPIPQSIYDKL
ncbi:MAG: capsular exopolysaccharide family [Candidatus Sulfotelmatobacter sp.]|nr:capsular exopolysaccharide family [Candidatus Sulfotelmatobacter sp.]